MTHVEKMRLQAALKALQGNLPRCTAPRHSEPACCLVQKTSKRIRSEGERRWLACRAPATSGNVLLRVFSVGCNASSLCKTQLISQMMYP